MSIRSGLLFLILLQAAIGQAHAQVLELPDRAGNALSGSELISILSPLTLTEREDRIYSEVLWGNVPNFLRFLVPVTSSASVGGSTISVTYSVTPDYLAIGSDDDYFLAPMTPLLAQRIADATGTILPTRKMVNDIYAAAEVKLAPAPIPPSADMITVPVFARHDSMVWAQRSAVLAAHPLGALVGGTKKDVVISNRIRTNLKAGVPKPVVIYGWHQLDGSPIQPLYNGHGETYADYSHGIRLVLDSVGLGGATASITAILQDAANSAILSDEGSIAIPRYGDPPADVESEPDAGHGESHLFQNWPNPCNPFTQIQFQLSSSTLVRLSVHDLLGRQLALLVNDRLQSGRHLVSFNGAGFPTGVYVYRLVTPFHQESRRLVVVR